MIKGSWGIQVNIWLGVITKRNTIVVTVGQLNITVLLSKTRTLEVNVAVGSHIRVCW